MEEFWDKVMEDSLAGIERVTGAYGIRHDIREIDAAIAAFKARPGTTWELAETLNTKKSMWIWAHLEKSAHRK